MTARVTKTDGKGREEDKPVEQGTLFYDPLFDEDLLRKNEVGLTSPHVVRQWFHILCKRRSFAGHGAPSRILVPGAGAGVEGMVARSLWPDAYIVGVELRPEEKPTLTPHFDEVFIGSFEEWMTHRPPKDPAFDLVVSNPPFSKARPKDGVTWIARRDELLVPDGTMSFLLPNDFLNRTQAELSWLCARGQDDRFINAPIRHSRIADRLAFYGGSATDSNTHGWWTWMRTDYCSPSGERPGVPDPVTGLPVWQSEQLLWLPGPKRRWRTRPGSEIPKRRWLKRPGSENSHGE